MNSRRRVISRKDTQPRGNHEIHKLDEGKKKEKKFYDEDHDEGFDEKYGDFHEERKHKKGGNVKSGHHTSGHHHEGYGNEEMKPDKDDDDDKFADCRDDLVEDESPETEPETIGSRVQQRQQCICWWY